MDKFITQVPKDCKFVFDEKEHKYYVNNVQVPISVSQSAKLFFSGFDTKKVAEKIHKQYQRSQHWNKDPKVIEKNLKLLGETASAHGTEVHKVAELYYLNNQSLNGIEYDKKRLIEVPQLMKFCEDNKERKCVGVEVNLFYHPIAGQPDKLDEDEDGSIVIVDWKITNCFKKAEFYAKRDGRFAKKPFDKMLDTKLSQYVYQQNMYKWILQKNGYKVGKMFIVRIKGLGKYEVIEIPNIQPQMNEAYQIIRDHCSRSHITGLKRKRMTESGDSSSYVTKKHRKITHKKVC